MNFHKLYLLLLNICFVLGACSIDNRQNPQETILQINDAQISRYEYAKELKDFIADYKNRHKKSPSRENINEWNKSYHDNIILLSEAYKQNFHNNKEITLEVENVARAIVTQNMGFTEEALQQLIACSDTELKAELEKSISYQELVNSDTPRLERLKTNLKNGIEENKRQQLTKEYSDQIFHQSQISIDESSLAKLIALGDEINKNKNPDLQKFLDKQHFHLFKYKHNGQTIEVSSNEFIQFYNNQPIVKSDINHKNMTDLIHHYVLTTYSWSIAGEKGTLNDPRFLMSKQRFKHRVMAGKYLRNYFKNTIHLTEEDYQKNYQKSGTDLQDQINIDIFLIPFSFKNEVNHIYSTIKQLPTGDLPRLKEHITTAFPSSKQLIYNGDFASAGISQRAHNMISTGRDFQIIPDKSFVIFKLKGEKIPLTYERFKVLKKHLVKAEKRNYQKQRHIDSLKKTAILNLDNTSQFLAEKFNKLN